MLTEKLVKYFDLGFEPLPPFVPSAADHVPLALGGKLKGKPTSPRQKLLWEVEAWVLLTCGIFLRKALVVADLTWVGGNLNWKSFLASIVVAFVAFPAFMRWFNRRRPGPTLEHFATAFGFGFCLDLAFFAAHRIAPILRG